MLQVAKVLKALGYVLENNDGYTTHLSIPNVGKASDEVSDRFVVIQHEATTPEDAEDQTFTTGAGLLLMPAQQQHLVNIHTFAQPKPNVFGAVHAAEVAKLVLAQLKKTSLLKSALSEQGLQYLGGSIENETCRQETERFAQTGLALWVYSFQLQLHVQGD